MSSKTSNDIVVRHKDGVMVVRLVGPNLQGLMEVRRVESQIRELIDAGNTNVIIDFKPIRYAGSAALGMMMSLARDAKAGKFKLVLSNTTHIDNLLDVSKTRKLFRVAPDLKAGMKLF